MLALTPILFGVQQAVEGFVWLSLINEYFAFLTKPMAIIFLMFALMLWPLWSALSMFFVEQNRYRKQLLMIVIMFSCLLAIYAIYPLFLSPVNASIAQHSILYIFYEPPLCIYWIFALCYALATIGPLFVSSLQGTKIAGSLIIIVFFIAYYIKQATFGSVWCFFAALISALVLLLLPQK